MREYFKSMKKIYNKLDINNFRSNYNPIFWNLIYYFYIENLPFDFILPYENEINLHESTFNFS